MRLWDRPRVTRFPKSRNWSHSQIIWISTRSSLRAAVTSGIRSRKSSQVMISIKLATEKTEAWTISIWKHSILYFLRSRICRIWLVIRVWIRLRVSRGRIACLTHFKRRINCTTAKIYWSWKWTSSALTSTFSWACPWSSWTSYMLWLDITSFKRSRVSQAEQKP